MSEGPPAVSSSSTGWIVAPSSPVPMERLERGLKVLRRAVPIELKMADNLLEQEGFLAGSDAARLSALHRAFADPDAAVLFTARGGYGITRLLGQLDPERLRRQPKLLVGFSDFTALLCWAYVRAGLRGIHGPVVTQMSTLQPDSMTRLTDLIRGEVPPPLESQEGTVIGGGTVEGELIVGNLEVLRSLIGTRYFPDLNGKILALEDVGERPYRLDRSLTQMLSSTVLRGVRGVVVGQLVGCGNPTAPGPSALEVVVERLGSLGVPVATGFEFGHDDHHNVALPFGSRVRLHADACSLEFLDPVTG